MFNLTRTTTDSGVCILRLQGRIGLGPSLQQIERALAELIESQSKRVALDLSGVTFIDSSVVGTMVMCANKIKASGGTLVLAGPEGVVRQTLTLCRIDKIVPLFASADEAVASFSATNSAQGSVA